MNLIIYTFGYQEAIYQILSAVAMIRNSTFFMSMIQFVAIITALSYGIKGAYLAGSSGHKQLFMKGLGIILVVQMLLLPKTSMLIRDNINQKISKVDNIPVAFALPVGVIEAVGNIITMVFEQALSPIEALGEGSMTQSSYYKYGSVFSARLKKELAQSRIKDPEFMENMRNFHKQCIMLPAMIGHQFTPRELLTSRNVWKLVKDKAGTLTRLYMRVGKTKTTMHCKEASEVFENYFNDEIVSVVNKNINKVFGKATPSGTDTSRFAAEQLNQIFFNNIRANYTENPSAQDVIKQHMMVNFLNDVHSKYGSIRAKMQQESGSLVSGNLAQEFIPVSLAIFKCFVVIAFIFIIPAMIMPGGMIAFTGYLKIFFSLQLWPAINSVFNMIMIMYSNLTPGNNLLVSVSTASSIENKMDTIVTVAANLQIMIPIIAYLIVTNASSVISNLAGSIAGNISQSANMAAGELTTGNRSFDNISEGNLSRNMKNANKTDFNQSYVSGEIRQQLSDGTIKDSHIDGTSTYSPREPAANYDMNTNRQAHMMQSLNQNVAEHEQNQTTLSNAQSNTKSQGVSYLANLIERASAGENLNINESTKEGKALTKLVDAGTNLTKGNHYDATQAATALINGSGNIKGTWGDNKGSGGGGEASGGNIGETSKGVLGNMVDYAKASPIGKYLPKGSGDISIGVNASAEAKTSAIQSVGENVTFNKNNNVTDNLEVLKNSDKAFTHNTESSKDQQKARDLKVAFEEQTRAEEAVTNSASRVKEHQQAIQYSTTVGATSGRNMKQDVIKSLMKQGISEDQAAQMTNSGHPRAQRAFDRLTALEVGKYDNQINQGKEHLSKDNSDTRLQNVADQNTKHIEKDNLEKLIKPGENPTTADFSKVEEKIDQQGVDLNKQYNDQKSKAVTETDMAKGVIENASTPLKKELRQEDEKSVRNKWYGKGLGIGREINGGFQEVKLPTITEPSFGNQNEALTTEVKGNNFTAQEGQILPNASIGPGNNNKGQNVSLSNNIDNNATDMSRSNTSTDTNPMIAPPKQAKGNHQSINNESATAIDQNPIVAPQKPAKGNIKSTGNVPGNIEARENQAQDKLKSKKANLSSFEKVARSNRDDN